MQATTAIQAPAKGAPPQDDTPRQFLRLRVGEEMFATGIAAVREILEVGQLTALPQTPAFVRGVMNLRGAVVPVIDLGARFGGMPAQVGKRTCIVVVEIAGERQAEGDADPGLGGHIVGMLVDAVYEVFEVSSSDLEPVPAMGTRIDAQHLCAMARVRGQVCAVLNLDHLLAQSTLAELIAGQRSLS